MKWYPAHDSIIGIGIIVPLKIIKQCQENKNRLESPYNSSWLLGNPHYVKGKKGPQDHQSTSTYQSITIYPQIHNSNPCK